MKILNHSQNNTLLPSRQKAFTLIELLIVIAIIALLAAILFPVFGRARENARRSSCQSNMKQVALGITQYGQDYDERMPAVRLGGAATLVPYGWADSIQPYLKSTQIYQCPSETNGPDPDPTLGGTGVNGYTDYWFNHELSSKSLALLTSSSQTLMIGDGGSNSARYNHEGCGTDADCTGGAAIALLPSGQTSNRHLEGLNFAFADGHVKWLGCKLDGSNYVSPQIYNSQAAPGSTVAGATVVYTFSP